MKKLMLEMALNGLDNREIATNLQISRAEVENFLNNISIEEAETLSDEE